MGGYVHQTEWNRGSVKPPTLLDADISNSA